jgi:hypothetical protein
MINNISFPPHHEQMTGELKAYASPGQIGVKD